MIFGNFEKSSHYDETSAIPDFLLTSARSVFRGPLSFVSMMMLKLDDSDRETFWSYTDLADIARIQMMYTDQLLLLGGSLWFAFSGISSFLPERFTDLSH